MLATPQAEASIFFLSLRKAIDSIARISGPQRINPPAPSTVTSTRVPAPPSSSVSTKSKWCDAPPDPRPDIAMVAAMCLGGSKVV